MKYFLISLFLIVPKIGFSRTDAVSYGDLFQTEGTSQSLDQALKYRLDELIVEEVIASYGLREYIASTTVPDDDHETYINIYKVHDISYVNWKCDSSPGPYTDSGVCGPSEEIDLPVCEYVLYYPSEDYIDLVNVPCTADPIKAIPNFQTDEDEPELPTPTILKRSLDRNRLIEATQGFSRYHLNEINFFGSDHYWFGEPRYLFYNETDNTAYFEQAYSYIEEVSEEIGASKAPINNCKVFFYDFNERFVGETDSSCGAKIVPLVDSVNFSESSGKVFEEEVHRTLEKLESISHGSKGIKRVWFLDIVNQDNYPYRFKLETLSGSCEHVLYNPAKLVAKEAVRFTGISCQ